MKAAVFHGINDLRVDEVARPRIDETEILIKVRAVAVCGTDNRIYRFGHFRIPTGTRRVLGHEVSGEVVEVGARVRDFAKGDRVAVAPNVGCGTCHLCVQGFHQLCPANEAFGITLDGGFEEYMKVSAFALINVAKIPAEMGFEEATLIEPLSCVFNAYEAHRTVPGDTVCVSGAGPIGTFLGGGVVGRPDVGIGAVHRAGRHLDIGHDTQVIHAVGGGQLAAGIVDGREGRVPIRVVIIVDDPFAAGIEER